MNQVINQVLSTQKTIIKNLIDDTKINIILYKAYFVGYANISPIGIIQENDQSFSEENQNQSKKIAIQQIEIVQEMQNFDDLQKFLKKWVNQTQEISNQNMKMGSFICEALPTKNDQNMFFNCVEQRCLNYYC